MENAGIENEPLGKLKSRAINRAILALYGKIDFMDPSSIVLATISLLVLSPFALVGWAQRENLAGLKNRLLGLKGQPGRNRLDGIRLLFADDVNWTKWKLESEYQVLQKDLIASRQSMKEGFDTLKKLVDSLKELEGRCQAAKAKVKRLERNGNRTPGKK
jgi:hypothetical protein